MTVEFITKADLQSLKNEIIQELKALHSPSANSLKAFLKSSDVRNLLACSHGTLQNLRIKGILTPSKIGGSWYYKTDQVFSLLQNGELIN
jgi:hypothetical protein